MADQSFDIVVIGSGPGGYVAAIKAAQLGFSTAIVEKEKTYGGTCLNIGCIPSKALLDSSEHYAFAQKEAADHGIVIDKVGLNLSAMLKRKDSVVEKLTSGVAGLIKGNKIAQLAGRGSIIGPNQVRVSKADGSDATVVAKHIVVATGSVPFELPFLPFDGEMVISSTEALSLSKVPSTLLVVGAGAIGLEMGSVWSRLGADVHVFELQDRVLPGWDGQVSKTMEKSLKKQGMQFHLGAGVKGLAKGSKPGAVILQVEEKGKVVEYQGDQVLVAVGRKVYTEHLGLDTVGIVSEERTGRIVVDDSYKTNVPSILAIGDVIDGPMLAHKAEEDAVLAIEALAGIPSHRDYSKVPNVVYTWPEGAAVGKTEEQLKSEGIPYNKGSFSVAANGRAMAMGVGDGFVKILAHKETDRILGGHAVGPWASDLMAEVTAVMEMCGSAEDLARIVHSHPTLTEITKEAALDVNGESIHQIRRR